MKVWSANLYVGSDGSTWSCYGTDLKGDQRIALCARVGLPEGVEEHQKFPEVDGRWVANGVELVRLTSRQELTGERRSKRFDALFRQHARPEVNAAERLLARLSVEGGLHGSRVMAFRKLKTDTRLRYIRAYLKERWGWS